MAQELWAQPYLLLTAMHMSGVLAFCLHKIGHGRVEDKPGLAWALFAVAAGPLIPIGGVGLVISSVWALFALSLWKVLLILFLAHLVWGALCWYVLGYIRVNGYEHVVHAFGIPLVLSLRFICASAAVLLLIGLWRG
jgi:hypothetical protein